ncbi:Thiosulfate sulfurtransferase GlpE [Methylobacterium crusticola]|uniref:Thiosulfate sulfurtransferase GlpE n=1 Tax=Methylobacterium crusticola TaxID=1697972 RepID=A0ABQ4RA12_9HYPH|nr:rhodanese-like domain-containing protein [Methylobacterium crusticola]GJD53710.1 Thiosulfate sulfurtransferase GlpE [Methylobacterium crusticola]
MTLAVEPRTTAGGSIPLTDVETLARLLTDGGESALVDVREEGVQARDGHILVSVPLPLSRLELRAGLLLPRGAVRIVVTDAGEGTLAARAAQRLKELGYADVSILDGGVEGWRASGREVYTGSSAYSKAFGEFVEHAYRTPHLSAAEVKRRLDAQDDIVVLDGRTLQEFEAFSIPGAHAVPNAELPYRVHDLVRSPGTLVVVNCAGRTRSIIGAQALINAGLPNPITALENGTMDWLKEGYALDHGVSRPAPAPSPGGLAEARRSVERLTRRFGLSWLDEAGLADLEAQRDARTLYLYDVRTRAEFEAGHLPGSHWAEGGQLVQGIDRFAAVRNARVVVIDDAEGVRAAITASWLVQLGWGEVHAYRLPAERREAGQDRIAPLGTPAGATDPISPRQAESLLARGGAVVLDLATSLDYAAGHVPGALFAVRSRLAEGLDRLLPGEIVLTSPDGILAAYAAPELAGLIDRPVRVLAGGTRGWQAAGLPVETGETALHHAADDVWRSPYHAAGDRQAAFRAYLDWEVGLLKQIARDATVRFRTFPPAEAAAIPR